jgi:uncharacterized protein YndB with AHSA1/START domain
MSDTSTAADSVIIERVFDAPIELIWAMWTDPEHFSRWYGPPGAALPVAAMDLRVGGTRRICMEMQTADGPMQMWFIGEYREVAAPNRLVYSEAICDPDGNVLPPEQVGLPDGHPATTEVVVELEDADGRTRMVMTHVGIPAGSPGEMGWNMAFDKLAAQCRP